MHLLHPYMIASDEDILVNTVRSYIQQDIHVSMTKSVMLSNVVFYYICVYTKLMFYNIIAIAKSLIYRQTAFFV